MGAGIEPGDTAPDAIEIEFTPFEIAPVEIGDLQLAPGRGLQGLGQLADPAVVEVDPGDRPVGFGYARLLLQPHHPSGGVEFRDPVALRIRNVVAEHGGPPLARARGLQLTNQPMSIEDVVPEHQAGGRPVEERLADQERLGQATGVRLLGIAQRDPPLRTVAEQRLEPWQIVRRGDDQHLADPRQHQGRQRIVDHRLVVDREELLADGARQRVEPGPGAAREDDSLSVHSAQSSVVVVSGQSRRSG